MKNIEDWFDEFSGTPLEEISRTRIPFLRIGWNTQLIRMREFGFLHDSSMVPTK
uniref:Uncharacterized protein n=1 Tax=Tetranychus urticae TaxID=32264 RepID=T1KA79_TETUR